MKSIAFVLVAVAGTATLRPTRSDPVGVYGTIDSVTFLPDAQAPTQAEIHGAFCIARGAGDYYTAPQRGYLLFRVVGKPGDDVQQWRELAALAGTSQVIGFSSRYEQGQLQVSVPGQTRPAAATYSTGWGLHRVDGVAYGPARELTLLPRPISPLADSAPKIPASEVRPARKVTFTVANCAAPQAGLQYLFEVETGSGDLFASPAVAPGEQTTSWTAEMALLAGDRVTWRARVLSKEGRAPVATASFVVGTQPPAGR
jgi:hypothetical protein